MVLLEPREQHGAVALAGLQGHVGDPVDELGDGRALADHLHVGVVVGPGVVADEPGGASSRSSNISWSSASLVGRADVEEGVDHLGAHVAVGAERAHRDRVGVVAGDRDQPLVVGRVRVQPVLRHPAEPLGGDPDRALVVAQVLPELETDGGQLLVDLRDPRARLVVAVDAGAPEVAQRLLQQPGRLRVERARVQSGEHVVGHRSGWSSESSLCTSCTAASPRERTASSGCTSLKTEPQATAFDIPAWPSSQMRRASSAVVASPALSRVTASRAAARPSAHRLVEPVGEVLGGGQDDGSRSRGHRSILADRADFTQAVFRSLSGCSSTLADVPTERADDRAADLGARAAQSFGDFEAVAGSTCRYGGGSRSASWAQRAGKSSTMRMIAASRR